jgi:hypothetical protein
LIRSPMWYRLRTVLGLSVVIVLGGKHPPSTRAEAQAGIRALALPDQIVPDAFSVVVGVRELGDGRVLVADRREKRLVLVQFSPLLITDVGRNGDGPGEYNSANGLIALGGDTTLLADGSSRRWLLLDGISFVRTTPAMSTTARNLGTHLHGGDARGRVLVAVGVTSSTGPSGSAVAVERADSIAILLLDLYRGNTDTIVRLRGRYRGMNVVERTVRGVKLTYHLVNPLATEEQAHLFSDGWIAVLRSEPYRVEWLSPGGQRVRGPALPLDKVIVDEVEKQELIRRHWNGEEGVVWPSHVFPGWPAELPAFANGALLPAPDGRLLVRRLVSARLGKTYYDVIDRSGRLAFRLQLGTNERIVGSGKRHIYTVTRSADGLESLARHAW